MEEDFTLNYMALLACIISPMSSEKSIKMILNQKNTKPFKRYENNKSTLLIDTMENKQYKFRTQRESCEFLQCHHSIAGIYRKSGKLYRNRYLFK